MHLIYMTPKPPVDFINGAKLDTFNQQPVLFQPNRGFMSVLIDLRAEHTGSAPRLHNSTLCPVWTSTTLRTRALHHSVHAAAGAARTLNKPFSSAALMVNHTAPLTTLGWSEIGFDHSPPAWRSCDVCVPAIKNGWLLANVADFQPYKPFFRPSASIRKTEADKGDTPTQEVPTLTPRILNSARARLILEDAVCRSFPLAMTLTSRES